MGPVARWATMLRETKDCRPDIMVSILDCSVESRTLKRTMCSTMESTTMPTTLMEEKKDGGCTCSGEITIGEDKSQPWFPVSCAHDQGRFFHRRTLMRGRKIAALEEEVVGTKAAPACRLKQANKSPSIDDDDDDDEHEQLEAIERQKKERNSTSITITSPRFPDSLIHSGIGVSPSDVPRPNPQTLEVPDHFNVDPPSSTDAIEKGPEKARSGLGSSFRYLSGVAGGWWDKWMVMGAAGSKLEKALGDQFPEGERYFGLENFGNTCYCNSVLQALYFCIPFREHLLNYYTNNKNNGDAEENLLTCLAELFTQVNCP
ncbi:uncharacterized protein LOC141843995 [Curcuma longa]|uniref:uncharacterized protein LOC141843995 n=1 Tax=Curcuma longa TaxID=136217 RepID=UPI003D9E0B37